MMSAMARTDVAAATGREGPARGSTGALVELVDLYRRFGPTRALDGLTLTIQPGELISLLGPSGCGKTTALRVLAGFETPDKGRVLVDGKDLGHVAAQHRDMGMVFQSYSLFPNMNALDNVGFGLRMRGVKAPERRKRAASLLEMVGLSKEAKKYAHQLSGGQQQRVALARALAIEPRVLLLDEPLSALDAKVRVQLREQIRALQTRLQITTVFVTHDQEEALSISDRVCVMREGRIEQVDVPAELYANPATAFVAEFVGTMNRIPARASAGGVVVLGREVAVRGDLRTSPGAGVDVLVRPEELAFGPTGGRGVVVGKTFFGAVTRVSVLLDGGNTVNVDRNSADAAGLEPGELVEVAVVAAEVMVAESDAATDAGGPDRGTEPEPAVPAAPMP
jgi:putative spermidine/putrescine transport system ATP-binding protein